MIINQEALDLIKRFEGLRLTAYQDSVGVWTIGYGTTARAGIGVFPKAGMTCTEAEAEAWLRAVVDKFARQVGAMITRPVTDNQFGAMVSLAYNIGPGNFSTSSVLKKTNAGDFAGAAASFALWNKAGGKVLKGLVTRRAAEAALYAKP